MDAKIEELNKVYNAMGSNASTEFATAIEAMMDARDEMEAQAIEIRKGTSGKGVHHNAWTD